jgi:hypothetical protein
MARAPLISWGEGLWLPPTKGLVEGLVPKDLSPTCNLDPLKFVIHHTMCLLEVK